MTRALAHGVAAMFTRRPLALILWMWSLVVAAAGAAPAMVWFESAWPARPQADALLQAFDMVTYAELAHYDASPTWAIARAAIGGAILLAFVGGAFMTAGVMHVVLDRDESERTRTVWSRLGRGGGQAFWRSLAVSGINAVAVVVIAGLAAIGVVEALRPLEDSPTELAAWLSMAGPLVPVALVVAVLSAVADYARLRVVADPVCGAFRAWFSALSFTLRHPASTTGIWAVFAALTGLVLVAAFAWSVNAPTSSTPWLIALVLAQQGVMVARAMIRVGAISAEARYAESKGFAVPELAAALVAARWPTAPAVAGGDALDAGELVVDDAQERPPS